MVWNRDDIKTDYTEIFAQSLQASMQKTLMESRGISTGHQHYWTQPVYLQARDWFLSSFPLLGAVASAFRIVDSGDVVSRLNIPVAAVSPQLGEIYINPRCRLNLEEWKFVLAHEFLHAALRHDLRCEDRIPELWNVACDYVVNDWLCEMKVGCMPESALFDNQFHGMSAEAIYDQICENIRQYLKENPGDLLYGDGSEVVDLNGNKLDSVYRSALQQGLVYHTQQNRGYLPVGLIEEIHALSRPPISWDVELGKWFDENFTVVEKHRSYARLSRRQSSTPDIPRPAWRLEEHPEKQICVIDSRAAAGAMVLLIRRAQALMEAAGDDGDFDALCQQLHRYQATLRTCFTLENFDNLIKNGRMRPIVGTLLRSLGIHIIADATAEGTIHVADKARGVGKTYRAITALMKASKDCTDAEVVISHCENLEGAMALKRQILADLPVKQVDLLSCRGLTSFYAMEKGLIVGY